MLTDFHGPLAWKQVGNASEAQNEDWLPWKQNPNLVVLSEGTQIML